MADEASQCTMEVANRIKEEGTEVMSTTIPDPRETGGVEATKIGKGNPSRNVGTVARKATRRARARRSSLIQRKPDLDPDKPTREIGNVRTTPKDRKKSEKG